jgi:hypothetical protein
VLDYHSSVPQAAETAVRNGVGTLVLTHLGLARPDGALPRRGRPGARPAHPRPGRGLGSVIWLTPATHLELSPEPPFSPARR